jgi:tetrahydromethanopterin S-methyltransferase subunit C
LIITIGLLIGLTVSAGMGIFIAWIISCIYDIEWITAKTVGAILGAWTFIVYFELNMKLTKFLEKVSKN